MSPRRRRSSTGHPRSLVLAFIAVLAVSGCAPAQSTMGPDAPAGSDSDAAASSPENSAGPSAFRAPEAPGQGDANSNVDLGEVPVQSADLADREIAPDPVQLRYPDIDADMEVEPKGVASDGQMEIPDDAAQAGWYEYGNAPADDTGTTVIAAHAGSRETPVGPLYALKDAEAGEQITVVDDAGDEHRYEVTEVQRMGKEGLDFTPYFERSGQHRLVLITCGGQWIPEQNSYADNIIVVAESLD